MSHISKVLIQGAGIGGLGASAALAQRGIEVEVIEIKDEPNVYGVGINQPANALRCLDSIGVLDQILDAGFVFDRWTFNDHLGNLIVSVPSKLGGHGIPPNNGLSRRDLHQTLIGAADAAGATIRYGTSIRDVVDESGRVGVTFVDGREDEYDLVVGFDGINSELRRRLFGQEYDPVYSGYAVWRVTVARPSEVDYAALYQAPGAKAGHIPLSKDTMYLLLVTPEPAHARYEKAKFVEMLRERLEPFEGIVGDIRDNLTADDDVVFSPLSEVMLPAPWSSGRVLICGDAAHACTPHLTQGAAMALEDAVVLADELSVNRSLRDTLTAFCERRHPRARFVQDASRGILNAEMQIVSENLSESLAHMRAALPGQLGHVDEFLNTPA